MELFLAAGALGWGLVERKHQVTKIIITEIPGQMFDVGDQHADVLKTQAIEFKHGIKTFNVMVQPESNNLSTLLVRLSIHVPGWAGQPLILASIAKMMGILASILSIRVMPS